VHLHRSQLEGDKSDIRPGRIRVRIKMQTATTPREYFVITTGTSSSSVTRPVAALSAPPHHALRQLGEVGLSAVRIVVSFLFACHGARILFGIFGGAGEHGPTAPVGRGLSGGQV
jgi:hypothetical protein